MKRSALLIFLVLSLLVAIPALAGKPPIAGAQRFEVYDETSDGLNTAVDPDIGNVSAVANPGGTNRLIIEIHIQHAAPNCTLTVELVRASQASNGGLSALGHTGFIQDLGTLTTNGAGNGNAHFDIPTSADPLADTQEYGHLDLEDRDGTCNEDDGTGVTFNEYGAAPDPVLATPFTWFS